MLSKLFRSGCYNSMMCLSVRGPQLLNKRHAIGRIPPDQYDVPIPNKLKFGYVIREYWEVIPLFFVTFLACVCFVGASTFFACKNKVDVVFSTRNRCNISRTMDMRHPTAHKIILMTQRYDEPWPEMADVLEKMAAAEKRALIRSQTCSSP